MNFKTGLLLFTLCVTTCLNAQETTDSTNTYKSLYTAKIDLAKGTETWSKSIAAVVFDKTISEGDKTSEFFLLKQENDLLVNPEIPLKNNKDEPLAICETLKKTCRSEECVADTLIEILGDGNRNVLIKYERKLLSVQIYYTYQDCQK